MKPPPENLQHKYVCKCSYKQTSKVWHDIGSKVQVIWPKLFLYRPKHNIKHITLKKAK